LDDAALNEWRDVRQVRDLVAKKIEEKRELKQIGSSLAAEVCIGTTGPTFEALARLGDDLRFVLITSRATVERVDGAEVTVAVLASANTKCERCWHYRADVNPAGLCGRCEANLLGAGEKRIHA
jgi:isoleucyl-tRNA synthetase